MKLPDESKLPATEFSCIILGETPQPNLGEVYVTFRSTIKRSEYMKEGAFPGT